MSLRTRFLVLIILPVAAIILATAGYAYVTARDFLVNQWLSSSNTVLKSVTGEIRCRLSETTRLMEMALEARRKPGAGMVSAFLAQKLLNSDGVRFVYPDLRKEQGLAAVDDPASPDGQEPKRERLAQAPSGRSGGLRIEMSLIRGANENYLEISAEPAQVTGSNLETLSVTMDFKSFIRKLNQIGLWKDGKALLLTPDGGCLTRSDPTVCTGRRFGGPGHPLEQRVLEAMKKEDYGTLFGAGRVRDKVIGFHRVPGVNWFVVLISDGASITGPLLHFSLLFGIAVIAALGTIPVVILASTRSVIASIQEISGCAERVERGDYTAAIDENRNDELGSLQRAFNSMTAGLRQGDMIQRTFGRYVDKHIAQELLSSADALNLGGEEKTVTILMSDLRGFTPMAEKLSPNQVITFLNRYLAAMIAVIDTHKGIIVDFYGDGILVFFNGMGAGTATRARDAVLCAVEMQKELVGVAAANQADGLPSDLKMGIGVHTGEVVVGNIGSETRAKYGIVGSPVNITQRIESTASGGRIVISEATYEALGKNVDVVDRMEVSLKGVEAPMNLFEIAHPGAADS